LKIDANISGVHWKKQLELQNGTKMLDIGLVVLHKNDSTKFKFRTYSILKYKKTVSNRTRNVSH